MGKDIVVDGGRPLSGAPMGDPSYSTTEQTRTLYTALTQTVNNIFPQFADQNLPADWGVTGTLDNLGLKDLVMGEGSEVVDAKVTDLTLNYNYRLISIQGLSKMKLKDFVITFNPPSVTTGNSSIIIATNLSLDRLVGVANLKIESKGRLVNASCEQVPLVLNGVTGGLIIEIQISNCQTGQQPIIVSASLNDLHLNFAGLTIDCDVKVTLGVVDVVSLNLNSFGSITSVVTSSLPKMREPLSRVINNALVGVKLPLCINLPPKPACLLGSDITGEQKFGTKVLTDFSSPDQCFKLCDSVDGPKKCNFAYWSPSPGGGTCQLTNTVENPVATRAAGTWYDRTAATQTKETLFISRNGRGMLSGITMPLEKYSLAECSTLCDTYKGGCHGFKYTGGKCNLYSATPSPQHVTLDLTTCARNFDKPFTFS